jgi:hypothetical protein
LEIGSGVWHDSFKEKADRMPSGIDVPEIAL